MDTIQDTIQDTIHGDITETPGQEPQKPCDRNSPCFLQRCIIGSTPTNHVRNQDVGGPEQQQCKPDLSEFYRPPSTTYQLHHPVPHLCVQTRHLGEQNPGTISLQPYVHLNHENPKFDDMFILNRKSNLDPSLHDCSNLHEYRRTAMDIINSFRSSNIPVPFWDFYNFLEFTPKFTTKPFNQA